MKAFALHKTLLRPPSWFQAVLNTGVGEQWLKGDGLVLEERIDFGLERTILPNIYHVVEATQIEIMQIWF